MSFKKQQSRTFFRLIKLIKKNAIFWSIFIVALLFSFNSTPTQASQCELLNLNHPVQDGFGAAYNTLSVAKETLITADCAPDSANITIGNRQTTQYIYKYGYIWKNNEWKEIEFAPAGTAFDVWFVGKASINIPLSLAELQNENYIVAYTCLWTGTTWKCGCQDAYCVQNYWQLQKFQYSDCIENWTCSNWTACSGSSQTRTCSDQNSCGTETSKPVETQDCTDTCQDNDNDGYDNCNIGEAGGDNKEIDCDDNEYWVNPNGRETCDTVDNNCNGQTDEDCDDDNDGYCDIDMPIYRDNAMCPKTIFTDNGQAGDDCKDDNKNINPEIIEICDGIDNDCDSSTIDGSGETAPLNDNQKGVCEYSVKICKGIDGWINDYSKIANNEYPTETSCDGLDNNCDGTTDTNCDCVDNQIQYCGSDIGECRRGIQTCYLGEWGDCKGEIKPTTEVCDGVLDDNCDGTIDENCDCANNQTKSCGSDIGECQTGIQTCFLGKWGDCENEVKPRAEACDGADNDCDGEIDENCDCVNYQTQACGSDIGRCQKGTQTCYSGEWGDCDREVIPIAEICSNNIDDDCDEQIDCSDSNCANDSSCDTTAPKVTVFNVNPTTASTNETITINYTVTDNTALNRVELWRTTDLGGVPNASNWAKINTKTVSGTSASGSFTDTISSAGTYWYGMHVVDNANPENIGYEPSPVRVAVSGVAVITGTSYFVKPYSEGGRDGNTGLSDAQAWATINKANSHNFQTGDNVFFKCGGTWERQTLTVDWSGTADNRVVVGAYYGNGIIGVSGNKPVISGTLRVDDLDTLAGYPNNREIPLLSINGDYITLQDMKIFESGGKSIQVERGSSYIVIDNCIVESGHMHGILMFNVDTIEIANCTITDTARRALKRVNGNWPGGIVPHSGTRNLWCHHNTIHTNNGEALITYDHANNLLIENNVFYQNTKAQILLTGAYKFDPSTTYNVTVRRNLIYGTNDSDYWRSGSPTPGIWFNDASYKSIYNISIYDNLIANCAQGFFFSVAHPIDCLRDVNIYNNTIVGGEHTFYFGGNQGCYNNIIVKNNIFSDWGIGAYNILDFATGWEFDYNLWSSDPGSSQLYGPNDPPYALPKLSKISGWNDLTAGSLKGSEFTLQSTSPAINRGANLGAPYNQGLNSVSTWVNNISTLNQNDYGNWEIGAFVFGE